ncbi:MAG: extracellular solute-binding protein [Lachnospiraceae bacterium]|nr:extracellular solute-binding protein [Lachnospiraceae bacterium]
MRRKYYKTVSATLCAAMAVTLAGCGSSGGTTSGTTGTEASSETVGSESTESSTSATTSTGSGKGIEVAYNLTTDDFSVFEDLMKQFTEESGVNVTIYNGGDDYESAMKTRMSSGDLPDMWVTHGWSLIRYSEYMMDLSDQAWVSDIDSGLKNVITNDDGELFILPITQAVASIMYNKDVLTEAGVDATKIRTWDDFTAACQSVLDKTDASPIEMCLGDGYDSYMPEGIWPTLYSNSDVDPNYAESLSDSSFDWESDGADAFKMMTDWFDAGFMNDDYVSGKKDDICKALANGEGAFSIYSTEMIPSVLAYNADANIGVLPLPGKTDASASYFGTGEGNFSCFGIWKDTKHEEDCKKLLEFLAKPEIAVQIVKIDGGIPALTTIELDETDQAAYTTNAFKEAQQQFDGDLIYDNFFDREYLPSGMWSVMADAVSTLLANGNPDQDQSEALAMVADNYMDLSQD